MTCKAPPPSSKRNCILTFFRGLLEDPSNQHLICWTDQAKQQFKLADRQKVTELWGAQNSRGSSKMTYDNMSRKLRHLCTAGEKLEKVKGSLAEWRFLDPESATIPRVSDSSDVQDSLLNSIQQLLSSTGVLTLSGFPSSSLEVPKENRKPSSFTIEEILSNGVVPDASGSSSSSAEVSQKNQKSCSTSWQVKPDDFNVFKSDERHS